MSYIFFNFLKSQGAVVDLTLVPSQTPLILEAKQWGARAFVRRFFVAAACNILMIEKLTGKKLDPAKYLERLRKNQGRRGALRRRSISSEISRAWVLKGFSKNCHRDRLCHTLGIGMQT